MTGGALPQDFLAALRRLFPGVMAAFTIALAATFLADNYGGSAILFALLLGMAFNFLSVEGKSPPGIDFASKKILRIGVALLGARISAEQVIALGWEVVLLVVLGVSATIGFGILLSRILGRNWRFGALTGGAVAICGASAALAISSVLRRDEHHERNLIFTVAAVTTLSTIAMVLYPLIVAWLGFDDTQAGIFLGGSIHDVAQVVGAGYAVSGEAGDAATLVKLLRVAMLLPVVFLLTLAARGEERSGAKPPLLPFFLVGFIAIAALNSFGLLPVLAQGWMIDASRWCLVAAIAAVGMKTSIKKLLEVGGQAVFMIVAETIFLGLLVLGFLTLI